MSFSIKNILRNSQYQIKSILRRKYATQRQIFRKFSCNSIIQWGVLDAPLNN